LRAKGLGAVLAVLLGAPLAAGCGAGRNNETDHEVATHLATADAGPIAVRGARLVPTVSTSGIDPTQGYLLVVLVNNGGQPDALSNATVTGGSVQPTGADPTALVVQPSESTRFGDPDLGDSGTALAVSGLPQPMQIGTSMQVTLQFRSGVHATLDVPVMSASGAGTTATAAPIQTTGGYPSPSTTATP
jgi:copper(I)-binding protein